MFYLFAFEMYLLCIWLSLPFARQYPIYSLSIKNLLGTALKD